MRTPLVIGNWKMNTRRDQAVALSNAVNTVAAPLLGRVDVGVAPPALWLTQVVRAGGPAVGVYGQNASDQTPGAFTGELDAGMLQEAGAVGTLLGHSERRALFGEDSRWVGRKVLRAQQAGLQVVLCVGETLDARDAGQTWEVVAEQLLGGLPDGVDLATLVVAYEPVWAIGTGRTASPAQAQEVHQQIRSWWAERYGAPAADALRILYGGSVKGSNAAELLAQPDIDGALVGGASLDAEDFGRIIEAAAR